MNTENKLEIRGAPMALKQERKLIIFAISSLDKGVDGKALVESKKISLTLGAGYSQAEAVEAARIGLENQGLNTNDFVLNVQAVFVDADRLIAFPSIPVFPTVEVDEPVKPVSRVEKSKEDLVAHVRYVFDIAGTEEQKRMAELVIKKFKDNSFKKKLS